jgi:hypothetical protein
MAAAPPTLYLHGYIYVRVAPEGAAAADGRRRPMTDPDHVSRYGHIYERGIQTYDPDQQRSLCECSLL